MLNIVLGLINVPVEIAHTLAMQLIISRGWRYARLGLFSLTCLLNGFYINGTKLFCLTGRDFGVGEKPEQLASYQPQ